MTLPPALPSLEEIEALAAEPREQYLARFTDDERKRMIASIYVTDDGAQEFSFDGISFTSTLTKFSIEIPHRMVSESITRNRRNQGWSLYEIEHLDDDWFKILYRKLI